MGLLHNRRIQKLFINPMENKDQKQETFEIRDKRGNKRFFIDDIFDDVYARVAGPYGYAVYASLCRHANKKQKAWPGVDTLAERLGIGRKSVFAGLEILEFLKIISRDRIGKKCNNRYTLLDRSKWMKSGEVNFPIETSQKNSEVPFRYFTSSSGELHRFLTGTSIERKQKKGNKSKDSVADATPHVICKFEGCKKQVEAGKEYCKIHQPMNLEQFVVWCKGSSQKHICIIGEWAETVGPDFQNQGQWTEYINRNVRAATSLVSFDHSQLERGFEHIKKGIDEKWLTVYTLETLYKFVTNEKIK